MQNNNGWIALHRQIQYHWLWDEKPFSKAQAWIDLLMMANREDKKFLLGNELLNVEAGTVVTSELKLMERWGWGKCKTRAFLDLLQNDGMIVKKADRKKTTISIVNYRDYSVYDKANRPQTDREQTASRPRADTNNNNNNNNNIDRLTIYTISAYARNCHESDLSALETLKKGVEEIYEASDDDVVRIDRKNLTAAYVKRIYDQANEEHIAFVLERFNAAGDVLKPKEYMQTALYNAVVELHTQWDNEIKNTMRVIKG